MHTQAMYIHRNASTHESPRAKSKYAREACTHAYTHIPTGPDTLYARNAYTLIIYSKNPHMNLNPQLTLCRSESQLYLTSFVKVPSLQNDKALRGKSNARTQSILQSCLKIMNLCQS